MQKLTSRLFVVLVLFAKALAPPLPEVAHDDNGAVASEVGMCSQVGVDLMKKGGNAADAIVGTVLCVGTVAMYHSGIGGGGFALIRTPAGGYDFIDFRETAPSAATEDMYENKTELSITGGLASGTPGELRGLSELHTLYGSLPWETVVRPAINIARDGFCVSHDLVAYMDHSSGPFPFLTTDPSWALDFAPNGTRLGLGDIIHRRRYADTLEAIATRGVDAFYTGPIANAMVQKVKSTGGIMTLDDLEGYKIEHRDLIELEYRGLNMKSCSAPSGGPAVASTLNIWQGFGNGSVDLKAHRLVESMKFAYGQRTGLGDPFFVADIDKYQQRMVSPEVADEIRSKINDSGVLDFSDYDPKGLESLETHGTSHIVAIDKLGFAISLTTTINLVFGSQVMVPETGVIMNNEMNDFSFPSSQNPPGYIPSEANFIRPGKRPLSAMSPTIFENPDGSVNLVIGAAGGSRIITATIQSIINVIDEELTPYEALARPRLHNQLVPNTTLFEYMYDNSTIEALRMRGQTPVWVAPGQSAVQGVRRLYNGTFEVAGEPRQVNSGGIAY